jgi:hypothetical protein
MLCSIELMLAGLCINIPMLRPFYLRWRTKHKISENSHANRQTAYRSDPLAVSQPGQRNHTAWIELVSRINSLLVIWGCCVETETDLAGGQGAGRFVER